ncbi:ATP-dependent Lon protease [Oceanospirillum multiglobuliferum]|uniref:Lon protease n=1 Tax=Oceanospirillum multiglobuliferum TaxID=64969 RepID=A0A1T4R687_9GAMM|nr:endopeptidase La [Oceanospirillum multiglobuliferum]OPX55208.1 endopeptidase La [Oceanospirillum multiglobuliferum]SKA11580.1 ATP-dependent Lon protease [Oceanospirillum multiglobuliferum]
MEQKQVNEELGKQTLPLLPLRDVVVFPQMVLPLFVGRDRSINALEAAMAAGKKVFLAAQKDAGVDEPSTDDLYTVGTLASVLQLLKLPDGTVKVLIEGVDRAALLAIADTGDYLEAEIVERKAETLSEREAESLVHVLMNQFEQYVKLSKKIPAEVVNSLKNITDPSRLVDTMSAHLSLNVAEKQQLLELDNVRERLERLMTHVETEIDLLEVEKRVRGRVKQQMEKNQREYYLNEQMKAIQKEMGELDNTANEADELAERIETSGMPKDAKDKALSELKKLKMMSQMSAEATVVRSYIDWMVSLPWKKRSKVSHDVQKAEDILNEDHFGLDEVKERILDYLAVQKRVKKLKGPVLCLVGPPGVGKTSLGQSIARATNRQYVRMALGGVRDESEIRGHRRTYIGSMPGKLLQRMAKVGVKNPLFLLDEIDKMGMDHRGDPASALLEVLDPEQNSKFSDHYLEVDYDLSDVMFVCTANSMNIPGSLLDRMEVIRIPGYTEDEKLGIAEKYLVKKQLEQNGITASELLIDRAALLELIRYYTREAGVRGLEREIAKLCRKAVRELIKRGPEGFKGEPIRLTEEKIEEYCGVRKYSYGLADEADQVGKVTGLAWTQVGGELLNLEAVAVPGKGRLTPTGSLGDVMKESIQTAMTVVRSRAVGWGISPDFYEKKDIHVHVPEGATPKDGPSAGIGMCTAMISVLSGIPVKSTVAMTGEITLRGEVLPIGGLKEKLLAARRGGIKTVIIPEENRRDLKEVPDSIKSELDIFPVKWIDDVLAIALAHAPTPFVEALPKDEASVAKDDSLKTSTH